MTIIGIDISQRKAATVAGLLLLFGQVPAIFGEFYVPGQLIDYNNAAETARNIIAHERLFRLGIASNLVVFAADVILITCLYVILERINRGLALLATFFRLVETAIIVCAIALNDFSVLRLLSGADYLRAIEPDRLQALARLAISAHGAGYIVGLMFFGLGSTMFAYLWHKSNYIPRVLAAWGVFASLLTAVCTFAFVIFPDFAKLANPGVYMPIFIFEVTMGFWLSFKGLRPAVDELAR
ncbi:MAG: DUF4386 domain-containing protein [Gemmatimonadota bacterium]|nr:DUF4386 domain-containing protein [Gemmatimonadota bacterium]